MRMCNLFKIFIFIFYGTFRRQETCNRMLTVYIIARVPCVKKGGEEKESRRGGLRKQNKWTLFFVQFMNTLVRESFFLLFFPSLKLNQTVHTVISTWVFRGQTSETRVFYELKRQLSGTLDLKHARYIAAHKDLFSGQLQEFGWKKLSLNHY